MSTTNTADTVCTTHEIPDDAISVIHMPPPAAAKSAPYEPVFGSVTPHPEFSFAAELQSVVLTSVLDWTDELVHVHPCSTPPSVSLRPVETRTRHAHSQDRCAATSCSA